METHEQSTGAGSAGRTRFESARQEFERLELEDKAVFLIEAAFLTAGKALDEAGKKIVEIVDTVSESCARAAQEERGNGSGAEKPGNGTQPAP